MKYWDFHLFFLLLFFFPSDIPTLRPLSVNQIDGQRTCPGRWAMALCVVEVNVRPHPRVDSEMGSLSSSNWNTQSCAPISWSKGWAANHLFFRSTITWWNFHSVFSTCLCCFVFHDVVRYIDNDGQLMWHYCAKSQRSNWMNAKWILD